MIKKLLLCLIALSLPLSPALASESNPTPLEQTILSWKASHDIPAISVSIQKADQTRPMTYLYGSTTLHGKEKITPDTLFQIGSITKTFISAIVLQLEAEGKLNINDSLGTWFPEYPRWQHITIKQLLNMRSGIYNYSQAVDTRKMSPQQRQKYRSPAELIASAYRHPDSFAPGTQWQYSNTNYLLAGLLIERVSGQKLQTLLQDRILNKYNLSNTFYYPKKYPPEIAKRMAHGYRDSIDMTPVSPSLFGSAGAMISNSPDLIKWAQALFSGQVLPAKQLQEFMDALPFPDAPPKPKNSRFGLGIYATNLPGLGPVWWYCGVTSGYIAIMVWVPEKSTYISANIDRWQQEHYGVLMPQQELLDRVFDILSKTHYW